MATRTLSESSTSESLSASVSEDSSEAEDEEFLSTLYRKGKGGQGKGSHPLKRAKGNTDTY